ncbi:MAG: YggS family pyridoxal phosphate-dependent enzyme [Xanthomonadales bacterium]|nr:YggS family pyridoxal phosphate-dependent enzyme [Xanthomonadales bacterium]
MTSLDQRFSRIRADLDAASGPHPVRLLAVSKTQPAAAVRALAALGQRAFGENYVQEALAKQRELGDLGLDWHLIGPLQSNKCPEAARQFDWVQSIDREKLIPLLAKYRPADRAALNLLVQVNIDDEASKSGCTPAQVEALAAAIATQPRLRLRGLMAIPRPTADPAQRRDAFRRMRELFERTRELHPQVDTLSMGMSDDFAIAIEEGANLVRIGSALFGPRNTPA